MTRLLDLAPVKAPDWVCPETLLTTFDQVVVYGTGNAGISVSQVLKRFGVKILHYVDSNPERWGEPFMGRDVQGPDSLSESGPPVLIASYYASDIATILEKRKIRYYDFSFCVDFDRWKDHFNPAVFDVQQATRFAHECLTGGSQRAFLGCIRYRQTYDPLDLEAPGCPHYWHPRVQPMAGDVYIDGGAWTGDTLQELKSTFEDRIEVHSFEPDKTNFTSLQELVANRGWQGVDINCTALWHKAGKIRFINSESAVHTMQSRVADANVASDDESVDAIDLDSYCQSRKVSPSFLKLDVEGSELSVIEGGRTTLKHSRPRLALSAYHLPNDLWMIGERVRSINPDYRFEFAHHSQQLFESVVYASC